MKPDEFLRPRLRAFAHGYGANNKRACFSAIVASFLLVVQSIKMGMGWGGLCLITVMITYILTRLFLDLALRL